MMIPFVDLHEHGTNIAVEQMQKQQGSKFFSVVVMSLFTGIM